MRVITGPPGSGKSTLVRRYKQRGDLLLDVDALYRAITGMPEHDMPQQLRDAVLGCRSFLMGWLERNPDVNAWIIACAPTRAARQEFRRRFNATVYVLEVPAYVCMERIAADRDRTAPLERWREWVEDWWRKYERSGDDIVSVDGSIGQPVVVRQRRAKAV